ETSEIPHCCLPPPADDAIFQIERRRGLTRPPRLRTIWSTSEEPMFGTARREFITMVGGAVAAWPVAARAQERIVPVVGYLYGGVPEAGANHTAAFRKGLSEAGYVEGRNVTIEYRWGHNNSDRFAELAADLVRRKVSVIVTAGSSPASLAAKAATA